MALTLQIVPHNEISGMSSIGRIRYLLNVAKQDKIVLLEGRLEKSEEAELIKATMEEINEDFKGIELGVINPVRKNDPFFMKLQGNIVNALFGNRLGLTIIGPATIVKEIRKDPGKIQLLMREGKIKKKKRR